MRLVHMGEILCKDRSAVRALARRAAKRTAKLNKHRQRRHLLNNNVVLLFMRHHAAYSSIN